MGSIVRRINLLTLLRNSRKYSLETVSPWLSDNKPGPYPKTEEEKIAAAKKYGLLREEYEPFPNDGDGYGDYPKTLVQPVEEKDWYYPWTDPWAKRNYGDPIHPEEVFYTYSRIGNPNPRLSPLRCLLYFLLPMVGLTILLLHPFFLKFKIRHKVLEKQFPKPGVVHYTFDIAD